MERYKWDFTFTVTGGVFLALGIISIIIGAAIAAGWSEFKKDAVSVSAEITYIDTYTKRSYKKTKTYHDVYVEYEYDGVIYSGKLDYYSSGMREGDDLDIFIDPDNPSKNRSESCLVSGLMALSGLVFGGIGAGFLLHEFNRSVYIKKLIVGDKFIYAEYSGEERANVTINNVRYYQAVFVYEDGFGRKTIFKGYPYYPGSKSYIQGEPVKVYVDMGNDPRRYYVSREK